MHNMNNSGKVESPKNETTTIHLVSRVQRNLKIINSMLEKESEVSYHKYLASYLKTFPFFCRINYDELLNVLKKKEL